jgi:hypothetical protein
MDAGPPEQSGQTRVQAGLAERRGIEPSRAQRHPWIVYKATAPPRRGLLSGQEKQQLNRQELPRPVRGVYNQGMTEPSNIALSLKGPRGPAELSDFALAINALRNTLRNISRCVTGTDSIEYEVIDLRYSSAYVETSPPAEVRPVGDEIAWLYRHTLDAIQDNSPLDSRVDYPTLHAFNGFSSIAKKPSAALSLADRNLTPRFAERIAAILEPDVSSYGSATGHLEGLSIHSNNTFTLYPPIAGEAIECVFQRKDLDEVLNAVDSRVTVYGKMHYVKTKAFPVRCDVETFSYERIAAELPTLLNACGILRSTKSSQEMIRELRDEW